MDILMDIIGFIKSLSLADVTFYGAVLVLMMLIISLIYFIKENSLEEEEKEIEPKKNDATSEMLTLKEISEAIEEAEPAEVNLTSYEEEQEEKAIISYDELLKHKNNFSINYLEEENINDDLMVKKVDVDNLINRNVREETKINATVISYQKEEAFLEVLKALQEKLN